MDGPQTLDYLEDNIRCVIADMIYGLKCWKKSSKIGRPDWTTSEPAVSYARNPFKMSADDYRLTVSDIPSGKILMTPPIP
ncbi:hypothetical protein TNCV_3179891 [Trichonephila clavipes]|nr:hypothetical protein TNCV_3179891 [Trichonephila clavipes]